MADAATRPQYLGTGSALWTRMNGDDMGNAINAVYPLDDPGQHPSCVPGRLSDHPGLDAAYIREVSALVSSGDSDGDAFSDVDELYVTTDRFDACPDMPGDDAWPPDTNMDTWANVLDLILFKSAILTCAGDASYDRRYDLDAGGCVNVLDVMRYKPVILTQCTNP